jgi:hypothetical protein
LINLKIILLILVGLCASKILFAQVLDSTSNTLSGDTLLLPSDSLLVNDLKNRISIDTSSVQDYIDNAVRLDFSPIDSIYENSFLGDSLFFQEQVMDRIKNQLQNLEWQKLIALDFQIPSNFKLKGTIFSSYNFGPPSNLNALVLPNNSINGGLDLAFQPFAIPIKLTARYNQYAVIPQVENYVRISFDREFYREYLNDLINSKKEILDQAKQNLLDEKADLDSELAYQYYNATSIKEVQVLQTDLTYEGNLEDIAQFDDALPSTNFSTNYLTEATHNDSWSSASELNQTPDTLDSYNSDAELAEVNSKIQELENKRGDLSSKVSSLEKFQAAFAAVQGFKDIDSAKDWRKFLKYLDAFELGQTNPSYTVFILAKQPINGLNIKTEIKGRRYWFTHGQTQGFFILDPNSKENVIRLDIPAKLTT